MKILITGGAGYLGSILTGYLLAGDHEVTILDNFMYGQTSLNHYIGEPHFLVVKGDARKRRDLKLAGIDAADLVIPLAAIVGAPACDKDEYLARSTNVDAIATVIEMLSAEQKMIIPTTNSGYGIGGEKECTEDSPLNPISLYGRTKVEAEKLVLSRGNSVSLRLATVFGMSPRMRLDLLVNDFVYRALTERCIVLFQGNYRRNYIHIRDVARAFRYSIQHFETMRSFAFNIGLSEANLTKKELAEAIATHFFGTTILEAPIGEDPDQRDYLVSNARIENHGFKPQHSLERGIYELIMGLKTITAKRFTNL